MNRLLWLAFLGVAATALAALVLLWNRKAGIVPRAPHFSLVERAGAPVSKTDLRGQVWVADFLFTRCQATCPRMISAMYELSKRVPEARYVSFTVDPDHDTVERLRSFVDTMRVGRENWLWVTGGARPQMEALARGFLLPAGGGSAEEILHSERFVLVDRYGRIRGNYAILDPLSLDRDAEAFARMEAHLRSLLAERALPVERLPAVNAGLNATAGFFLLTGLGFIKARRQGAHKACMLAALGMSALFLVSYLTAHYYLGSTPYRGTGPMRTAYFGILLTHTVLAALVVPLALATVYRSFQGAFERHRALARWTFPIWLYVSVTGVVIYFMLY